MGGGIDGGFKWPQVHVWIYGRRTVGAGKVRHSGIRDDRTFLEQYIVLEEIGKRWIREHENMKKENIVSNQFKSWSDDKLLKFYKERKEIYNGNFPISYINMLAEISDRWIKQNEIKEIELEGGAKWENQ